MESANDRVARRTFHGYQFLHNTSNGGVGCIIVGWKATSITCSLVSSNAQAITCSFPICIFPFVSLLLPMSLIIFWIVDLFGAIFMLFMVLWVIILGY